VCNGNSNPQDCNADGVDDVCEDEYDSAYDTGLYDGNQMGDINGNGFLNVTDIILYVEKILSE
jgi:hypothetical protein